MLQWLILNCHRTLQVNFHAYYNNLVSQVRDLMTSWSFLKYFSLTNDVYWWNRFHFWWWVLLNRAPTSTQLHPPPPSSFQPLPSSINLHLAHFSLHPTLCNTLNNIWAKILHVIGQFSQIYAEKLFILTENWHTWYIGGVHSNQIQTSIFEIPTPKSILEQIWVQKFKVVCFVWKLVHIVF